MVRTFGINACTPIKLIFKLSSAGGDPIATTASPSSFCGPTSINLPFKNEPPPFVAVNTSFRCGSLITPTTTSPLYATAIDGIFNGIPCTKFVVPSIGSTIHNQSPLLVFNLSSIAAALASFPGGTSSSPKKA